MRAMWQMWRNYMPVSECERLIQQALTIPPMQATTFGNIPNLRKSKVRWIQRTDPAWDWVFRDLEYVIKRANVAFGFDLNTFFDIQFTEYNSEDNAFYNWHEDLVWIPPTDRNSQRKLSLVMQLSNPDSYEGGNLEFQMNQNSPDANELKSIGTTIVFPSFVKHRVTPVTKGVRYSLVTWYEGPPFR